MIIYKILKEKISDFLLSKYGINIKNIEILKTKKDFEGDITIVIFPIVKILKKSPVEIGKIIGGFLVSELSYINKFNQIQGFVNLTLSDHFYINILNENILNDDFGFIKPKKNDPKILVEFSSPNTNKPLHLGHIRNILLGFSVSKILSANGKNVHRTQIINDKGIHICKSIVAWLNYGKNSSPSESEEKGDHFVGKYYVLFDKTYKKQIKDLINQGKEKAFAEKNAPIFLQAQELLLKWESGDEQVIELWKKMNSWVYNGFNKTYEDLSVDFDSNYYESQTYLIGKEIIKKGLEEGVFLKEKDGSVWVDLTSEGLDKKILLRSDGTSVYMTQDLGTAYLRFKDQPDMSGVIYTVGNEQDYHFKVLFKILEKLNFSWSDNLYHLSYGMVDLPFGKMKSREGTVVDADEIILEMQQNASKLSDELGKISDFSDEEKNILNKQVGLAALKYYILKVDPKKRILFDPVGSIDFNGNTGPFIQYTYARIQSLIIRDNFEPNTSDLSIIINDKEKELIQFLIEFPEAIKSAGINYSPAIIANYVYELVKSYNSYYQSNSILKVSNLDLKNLRLNISYKVGIVIKKSMSLLGIEVPNKM
tara:strand:- start:65734 stop:67512 length:1779 start_codon:yes stop_codon:yes gene_type:complete